MATVQEYKTILLSIMVNLKTETNPGALGSIYDWENSGGPSDITKSPCPFEGVISVKFILPDAKFDTSIITFIHLLKDYIIIIHK
jgi:hypothetical protein